MYSKNFANLLKQKRTTLNISQSKVAKLCFLSKASYNHLERGIRLPSLETLIKLSQILYTEPSELLNAILSDLQYTPNNELIEEEPPNYSSTSSQMDINTSFDLLDSFQRKAILDIIDSLLNNDNTSSYSSKKHESKDQ